MLNRADFTAQCRAADGRCRLLCERKPVGSAQYKDWQSYGIMRDHFGKWHSKLWVDADGPPGAEERLLRLAQAIETAILA